jgi:hypothetical protein
MFKKTLLIILTIAFIAFSTKSFSQKKGTNPELMKIASTLIECLYITKASSMTGSINCTAELKQSIDGLSSLLKIKVEQHKRLITQKIGEDNFEKLLIFIKGCNDYSKSSEELKVEQRGSFLLWTSSWKSKIEEFALSLIGIPL